MICFATKMQVERRKKRVIKYRSYKNFDNDKYMFDLSMIPFNIAEIFDDIDDSYWVYETLVKDVINEHAPLKTKQVKHNMVPYMNSSLRKAINIRKNLWRIFSKDRSYYNWERYRKQRNKVVSLRKKSKNTFMRDKCASVKNGKEFWQNMKPLISNNIREENNDIVLLNDNVIVNDQRDVCNLLNDYFVNVTKDIGECDRIQETDKFTDIINTHAMHDSVQYIKTNLK